MKAAWEATKRHADQRCRRRLAQPVDVKLPLTPLLADDSGRVQLLDNTSARPPGSHSRRGPICRMPRA